MKNSQNAYVVLYVYIYIKEITNFINNNFSRVGGAEQTGARWKKSENSSLAAAAESKTNKR